MPSVADLAGSGNLEIEVKLFGALRQYRPEAAGGALHHPFSVTIPTGVTVAALAAHLGIPDGLVNAAAVNHESVAMSTPLQEGDEVSFFPPVAGG